MSSYIRPPSFFFADNTCILLKYFVFYCQSQGWNNEGRQSCHLGLVVLQTSYLAPCLRFYERNAKQTKPNQKQTCSDGYVYCAIWESFELFHLEPCVYFFISMSENKQGTDWPAEPKDWAFAGITGLPASCQSLLAAVSWVSPKGPRQSRNFLRHRSW